MTGERMANRSSMRADTWAGSRFAREVGVDLRRVEGTGPRSRITKEDVKRAARERGVHSPLAELGINKAGVRAISRALGFPWWDKPAQPCLASRFPYGEAISAERLQRVAAAEDWLRQQAPMVTAC